MNNHERIASMRDRLNQSFKPHTLEITDDSEAHKGHAGAKSGKGHFSILIESDAFKDCNQVQAHRLIYQCLLDMFDTDIHALAIQIKPCAK